VQVPTTDVVGQPAGTRFFVETIMLLPDDAQYVRPGASVAVNAMNNATFHEVNINGGTANPNQLSTPTLQPALAAWAGSDNSVVLVSADHDDTPNPSASFPGTTIRCRYFVAARVTPLSSGQFHYEYAVFNLNSDRAAGALVLPLGGAASFTDFAFHHPLSHSGEPYSNTPWTFARGPSSVTFATDPYATNPNANAIRWGTTYNFGFTTNAAPTTGSATLGLFQPGPVMTLTFPGLPVPTGNPCTADFNHDGNVAIQDLFDYLSAWFAADPRASINHAGTPTIQDIFDYLALWFTGCP